MSNHAFLTSPEYRELCVLRDGFAALGPAPYTVKINDDERTVDGVQMLLKFVRDAASKGLSIQRFKGLGEMNPEQLWDTTMNPDTRTPGPCCRCAWRMAWSRMKSSVC